MATSAASMRESFARAESLCLGMAAAFAVLGGVGLALLLGMTVAEIVARHLLGNPLVGVEDLATMALVVVVAAAVAYGARAGSHVSVNLLGRFGQRRLTRITDVAARTISVSATVVATYALFAEGACGRDCGALTGSLGIVHTPFYFALGTAMAVYALLLTTQLLLGLAAWHDEDPNEPRL